MQLRATPKQMGVNSFSAIGREVFRVFRISTRRHSNAKKMTTEVDFVFLLVVLGGHERSVKFGFRVQHPSIDKIRKRLRDHFSGMIAAQTDLLHSCFPPTSSVCPTPDGYG